MSYELETEIAKRRVDLMIGHFHAALTLVGGDADSIRDRVFPQPIRELLRGLAKNGVELRLDFDVLAEKLRQDAKDGF